MTNLENLTQRILEDAKEEAEEIIRIAEQKKADLINEKVESALIDREKILKKAQLESNLLKERIISDANLSRRDEILKAKQEIIEKVFEHAMKELQQMDDEEYIHFLQKKLADIELKGTEVLIVPKNKRILIQNLNLPIKVCKEETVDSGFIITRDSLQINYSFQSLMDFNREELETLVAQQLFNEQE